jgi:hypothetical protein
MSEGRSTSSDWHPPPGRRKGNFFTASRRDVHQFFAPSLGPSDILQGWKPGYVPSVPVFPYFPVRYKLLVHQSRRHRSRRGACETAGNLPFARLWRIVLNPSMRVADQFVHERYSTRFASHWNRDRNVRSSKVERSSSIVYACGKRHNTACVILLLCVRADSQSRRQEK